jgi:hypothetical protein
LPAISHAQESLPYLNLFFHNLTILLHLNPSMNLAEEFDLEKRELVVEDWLGTAFL